MSETGWGERKPDLRSCLLAGEEITRVGWRGRQFFWEACLVRFLSGRDGRGVCVGAN
jgi:hypothetical protein